MTMIRPRRSVLYMPGPTPGRWKARRCLSTRSSSTSRTRWRPTPRTSPAGRWREAVLAGGFGPREVVIPNQRS
jgi:hypothetical protein